MVWGIILSRFSITTTYSFLDPPAPNMQNISAYHSNSKYVRCHIQYLDLQKMIGKSKKYSPKSGFHGDLSWCKVQNHLNKQIQVIYKMPTWNTKSDLSMWNYSFIYSKFVGPKLAFGSGDSYPVNFDLGINRKKIVWHPVVPFFQHANCETSRSCKIPFGPSKLAILRSLPLLYRFKPFLGHLNNWAKCCQLSLGINRHILKWLGSSSSSSAQNLASKTQPVTR